MIPLKLQNQTLGMKPNFQVLDLKTPKTSEVSNTYCAMVYISSIDILPERPHVLRLVPLMAWQRTRGWLFDGQWSACFALPCQLKARLTMSLPVRQSSFQLRAIWLSHCFFMLCFFIISHTIVAAADCSRERRFYVTIYLEAVDIKYKLL